MKNNSTVFFTSILEEKRLFGKFISFPLSLTLHLTAISALLIYPLINVGKNMPDPKNISVRLFSIPGFKAPGIQVSSGGGDGKQTPKNNNKKNSVSKNLAPVEIPDGIVDPEILPGSSNSDGVKGGLNPDLIGELLSGPTGTGNSFFSKSVSIIKSPVLLKRVNPAYPALAIRARVEGTVILESETDIYGKVIKISIISGHPLLNGAAYDAVKKWIYEPYLINGIPRPVRFTVNVVFRLTNMD